MVNYDRDALLALIDYEPIVEAAFRRILMMRYNFSHAHALTSIKHLLRDGHAVKDAEGCLIIDPNLLQKENQS